MRIVARWLHCRACRTKERNEVMKEKLAMMCGYLVAVALSLTALAAVVELSVADAPFNSGYEC